MEKVDIDPEILAAEVKKPAPLSDKEYLVMVDKEGNPFDMSEEDSVDGEVLGPLAEETLPEPEERREERKNQKRSRKKTVHVPKKKHKQDSTNWGKLLLYLSLLGLMTAYVYVPMSSVDLSWVPDTAYWVFEWGVHPYLVGTRESVSFSGTGYELWSEQHNTTSVPIDYRMPEAKQVARALEIVFRNHMQQDEGLDCICMHHLRMDRFNISMYQLCAVYNRPMQQLYMMANPTIEGHSQEKTTYTENSVSCVSGQWNTVDRHNHIFVNWIDPQTEEHLYYRFSGSVAACMQLSLEEIKGNHHC